MTEAREEEVVGSLLRGLDVIGILSRSDDALTLAEIARQADTSRATARRLLLTLEREGYVAAEGPLFRLRPRVMELGDAYLAGLGLPRIVHPHLVALSAKVRDTCSMTVLDGNDVVYVDRVKADRMMTVSIAVGTRLPAATMSSGRVLLGDLDEFALSTYLDSVDPADLMGPLVKSRTDLAAVISAARADGFAVTDQELDPSLRSVAVPVRDPEGRAVAAINVSTHVNRTTLEQLRTEVLPVLLETAREIEAALAREGSLPSQG
ncbi:MAG TPA: IclR family transcriptional regulator C-terminal domain-containing protein [Nocardioides sp.]|nr:IclR family transcriptional regulator C-terminal domain-containing protein [Nocardioides sp.]